VVNNQQNTVSLDPAEAAAVSARLPHALHKVVSPIVRDERYLVNKMLRLQLSRARMRHENQDRWWNSAAPPVKEE